MYLVLCSGSGFATAKAKAVVMTRRVLETGSGAEEDLVGTLLLTGKCTKKNGTDRRHSLVWQ